MPVVGVTVLPVPPGTSDSPAASIISHLSHLYPSESHDAYHIDHRLFLNTSSLLPSANQKDRAFTQILKTSHNPSATFVTVVAAANADPATITIPASSQDSFTQLLVSKFQPLWAHRQSLTVEGIRVRLPLKDAAGWQISLGDLRVAIGSGRSGGGSGVGNIRGVLVELQYSSSDSAASSSGDADNGQYEMLFRDLLMKLVNTVEDYKTEDLKFIITRFKDAEVTAGQENELAICKIYAELFRTSRA